MTAASAGQPPILSEAELECYRIYRLFRRVVLNKLNRERRVFKTLYRTDEGEWSENPADADWYILKPHDDLDAQPWNRFFKSNIKGESPALYVCDIKHEAYWLIDGVRYDDYQQAYDAMEYEMVKPYLPELILDIAKELKRHERAVARLTMQYDCEKGATT